MLSGWLNIFVFEKHNIFFISNGNNCFADDILQLRVWGIGTSYISQVYYIDKIKILIRFTLPIGYRYSYLLAYTKRRQLVSFTAQYCLVKYWLTQLFSCN